MLSNYNPHYINFQDVQSFLINKISLTSKGAGLTFDLPSDCFPLVGNAYDVAPLPKRARFKIPCNKYKSKIILIF